MTQSRMYKRHRFPPEIIQYAVWLYHRFNLGHRDVKDLMSHRGIEVSYEAIRLWCNKFGPKYAQRLRRKHQGYGDTFFIDEVFVKIQGQQRFGVGVITPEIRCRSNYSDTLIRTRHRSTPIIDVSYRTSSHE